MNIFIFDDRNNNYSVIVQGNIQINNYSRATLGSKSDPRRNIYNELKEMISLMAAL